VTAPRVLFTWPVLFAQGAAVVAICLAACGKNGGPAPERLSAGGHPIATRRDAISVTGNLKPGKIEQGQIAGAQPAAYRVALGAGDYLHATLEQQGVDAVAVLLDPDGTAVLTVDSPNGNRGPEHLFFVATRSGSYLLEVRAFEKAGGRFTLQMESRPATAVDRSRATACRAVSEGDAALAQDNGTAKREALLLYTEAIEQWRRTGEAYQEALTETKLGKALARLGEIRTSVQHRERALSLFGGLAIESQQPALRNDLGVAYERLGQLGIARSLFEVARASARRLGDRREETAAVNNLGLLEKDAGEPWRGLVLFEEALAGWRELGDSKGTAATLHNLGTLYTVLGKLPEAEESLQQALGIYRALGLRRDEAVTTLALGWVHFLQGDAPRGRTELLHSLDLRRSTGDRGGEAVTLDRLGTLSREVRELDRAMSEYRQALRILESLGDAQGKARTLSNMGETLTAKGDPAAGLRDQDIALQLLESQAQPSAEAYARFRRARAERVLGRLEAAWADMRRAIPNLERIRERAESDDLRMTYLDSVHELHEFSVDLLMELHHREPGLGYERLALAMVERSQARGLLDLVHEAQDRSAADRMGPRGGGLLRLEEEIRAAERRQAVLVAEAGRRNAVAAEESHVRRLLREREKILVELRLAGGAKGLPARPLEAVEIQRRLLDADTLLLVYFLGEKRSFVWAVSDRNIESAVLPPKALLERAAVRLHSLVARSAPERNGKQLELTAEELSGVLLGKVAHLLEGKRLVVVADGALAYVPFDTLPDPVNGGLPMIVRHEVVMLPSASVLAAIRERAAVRPPPPKLLAVVADPVFSRDDPRLTQGPQSTSAVLGAGTAPGWVVTRSARDLGLRGLARLPFSRREAEAILSLVRPEQRFSAMGFAANYALVTGGRLKGFRIVHFATHALIHPKYPELSGVVLSLVDERGRLQPGFLRSYQILSLHLPADLVVLSACRTGLGVELNGEGLVGLTQSFFHAGASRVLVSLWDVDDRATDRLMEHFYRELLLSGRPPSAALRAAQLSMRDDPRWSAPYYWAGFVLQGDWR